jgi:hypothetical protein
MTQQPELSSASQKLLREIAKYDQRDGTAAKYLSRGRYTLEPGSGVFNRATFRVLFEHDLILGWDKHDADGLLHLTDAGRKIAAELEAQQAEKKPRPKPNAESPSAISALRALAELPQPVRPHSGHRRGIWSLGSRDGYSARELTFCALEDAGYVRLIRGAHLSVRIEITDAGRARIARTPA